MSHPDSDQLELAIQRSHDFDCYDCAKAQLPITILASRMWTCPLCGNKRCPRATNHVNECTRSNDPGQKGSRYE